MLIYDDCGLREQHHGKGYKTPPIIGFDLIHPRAVAVKRPLRELTSENNEFLEKIGLRLKKLKTE